VLKAKEMARPGSGRAIYISGENTLAPDDLAALWRAVDYCGSAGGASSAGASAAGFLGAGFFLGLGAGFFTAGL
jgi:hypothetical protein